MAISKFSQTASTDMTNLLSFLNANKVGTFLENVEMVLSGTTALTLTGQNTSIIINTGSVAQDSKTVTYNGAITTGIKARSATSITVNITNAMLCKNGLILQPYTKFNSDISNIPQIVITVDNKGDLAVIFQAAAYTHSAITGYRVTASDSPIEVKVTLTPNQGAAKTSLAPIVPLCNDNNNGLPYAYAAIHTELSGVSLSAVTINGEKYITNGIWFVKDGA